MTASMNPDSAATELEAILNAQRAAFRAEGPVALETRIDRIDRCIAMLVDNKDAICEAVNKDFGCRNRYVTSLTDIMTSIGSLKFVKKNLKKWMKPEKRTPFMPMNFLGAKAYIKYQPKGVIGIMTPWNVPVNMIFSPLADALGAGNRAMIKPSEYTPHTAELMQKLFSQYFEPTEVAIVTGGPEVGAAFSSLKLDHIIFTGATTIGGLVMRAAAENMVPVTLELGGKSPVVVSSSADINVAAERIITGKAMNGGQLCVSPDYVFVPQSHLEAFIKRCREVHMEQYPNPQQDSDFVACINERHYDRVKSYIDEASEAGTRIVPLCKEGQELSSREDHKIALHLIVDPADELKCMQDEIFGAVMNVKTYSNLDEVIEFINDRERPLALYYFGKDEQEEQRVLSETISGGVTVNNVTMHVACDDLPFGGVGHSGTGNYRGREGFRTFSHARSVYKEGWVDMAKLAGTLPPYGQKVDKILDGQLKK